MVVEGHGCGGKKNHQQQKYAEMEKELIEIRERMEEFSFRMQQDVKPRWVCEFPMKTKVKWPVKELLTRR
jgi:hypothetical protein